MVDHTDAGHAPAGVPETLHYVRDVLGSVTALTDWLGAGGERYSYDPYGRTRIEDATGTTGRSVSLFGNPFAWTGQRYDAGVGLYHFLHRAYSPTLGRWLHRDLGIRRRGAQNLGASAA